MRKVFACLLLLVSVITNAQITKTIDSAIQRLIVDSQFKHSIVALYIVDSKTGKVIFSRNANAGLAPASCQKVITSTTAFELLGKDFTYQTKLGYTGKIEKGLLNGDIEIIGGGDPTLGSWRYPLTKENIILDNFKKAISSAGIKEISGNIITNTKLWDSQIIPDGWIWQDIGNYYGAGASALNWRENQYDIFLESGKNIGDPVKIMSTLPQNIVSLNLISELTSAEKGSGDNSYIYLPTVTEPGYIRGTIPVNEKQFTVSGSMPDGALQLAATLQNILNVKGIKQNGGSSTQIIYTQTSPTLDSINYWFLKRSVNLYGEALLKTIAYKKTKHGNIDSGINVIRDFWSKRGIEKSALKIMDGSGLSPANRVTVNSLVTIMQYAKKQNWFSSFYYDLPLTNNIKMKDGYISGVRSYTGYVTSKTGIEYTFSFIVNNFDGNPGTVREKMWKVLDLMK